MSDDQQQIKWMWSHASHNHARITAFCTSRAGFTDGLWYMVKLDGKLVRNFPPWLFSVRALIVAALTKPEGW